MNIEGSSGGLPASVRSLPELVAWRVAATPHAAAYRQFDTKAGARASPTWSQANQR